MVHIRRIVYQKNNRAKIKHKLKSILENPVFNWISFSSILEHFPRILTEQIAMQNINQVFIITHKSGFIVMSTISMKYSHIVRIHTNAYQRIDLSNLICEYIRLWIFALRFLFIRSAFVLLLLLFRTEQWIFSRLSGSHVKESECICMAKKSKQSTN